MKITLKKLFRKNAWGKSKVNIFLGQYQNLNALTFNATNRSRKEIDGGVKEISGRWQGFNVSGCSVDKKFV